VGGVYAHRSGGGDAERLCLRLLFSRSSRPRRLTENKEKQDHGEIQGSFGVIQGTFGWIQGTLGVIEGTFFYKGPHLAGERERRVLRSASRSRPSRSRSRSRSLRSSGTSRRSRPSRRRAGDRSLARSLPLSRSSCSRPCSVRGGLGRRSRGGGL
jgi:hypothetical protein